MQGFLIFDHVQRSPEALRELESWVRNGQIRYREDILDGIEQAPGSIAGLYRGENLGKRLIRIAPDVLPRDPFSPATSGTRSFSPGSRPPSRISGRTLRSARADARRPSVGLACGVGAIDDGAVLLLAVKLIVAGPVT